MHLVCLDPTSNFNVNSAFFEMDSNEPDTQCTNELKERDKTTRGILVACCPCGHILFWTEIYKCESISQVYAFLVHLWKNWGQVSTVIYDDSCHLKKYAMNKKRIIPDIPETVALSKATYGNITYFRELNYLIFNEIVVDRMHFKNHIDVWCKKNCDPDKTPELEGVNTEVCEQTFSWLNGYAKILRHANRQRFNFILDQVIDFHNNVKLKKNK